MLYNIFWQRYYWICMSLTSILFGNCSSPPITEACTSLSAYSISFFLSLLFFFLVFLNLLPATLSLLWVFWCHLSLLVFKFWFSCSCKLWKFSSRLRLATLWNAKDYIWPSCPETRCWYSYRFFFQCKVHFY